MESQGNAFQPFIMSGHIDICAAHWVKKTRQIKSAGNQPVGSSHCKD